MKTKIIRWFALCLFLSLTSCSRAEESAAEKDTAANGEIDTLSEKKVLIVYLSRTKNTKTLAEIIHSNVRGRLVAIELEQPYPEHYQTTVDQVAQENRTGYLPPLKTKIDNMDAYDIVFIGFPTWGMQLPPPVKSFLKDHSLNGKTVIPFNTNAGYGVGSSFEMVRQLCPDSDLLEGYSTTGGVERDGILFVMEGDKEQRVEKEVRQWLVKIGLVQ